ncbi:hypothetical protein BD408DRAFT_418170 [Parasitella parasitica]|nr:hypothetical protein BD408DRAFT_418170 [Parasitella parasitica]
MPNVDILNESSKPKVQTFLSAYPENYKFKMGSIFYDVKANPENHFKAFVKLAELFEAVQLKQFFCFPLRTTFIPCYMTLDNKIIHHHIIQSKKPLMPRINLKTKAFKNQGSLSFKGTLETDGVGASIIKQNCDTSRKGPPVKKRLSDAAKTAIVNLASEMLRNYRNDLKQRVHDVLQSLQLLPFRKLKFSSKLYYDKNDAQLVNKLKTKFGSNSVLVIGNWSAPNVKYHEPIRNAGLIKMLQKNGFKVNLIGEYKTSSLCPGCGGKLDQKFKTIRNPRPYQRHKMPIVKCHGLTR